MQDPHQTRTGSCSGTPRDHSGSPDDRNPSKESPKISVVVPVRNAGRELQLCLEALSRQSLSKDQYEVIVVDDGSVDDSVEVAKRWAVRIIRQERKSAAAARNRGVREARGEIVVFTDADCTADEKWLEKLVRPLHNGADGTVGRCVSDQRQWVARLVQLELDERYARMARHDRIDFLNTGNCSYRRKLLQQHSFDETLCAGWRTWSSPSGWLAMAIVWSEYFNI